MKSYSDYREEIPTEVISTPPVEVSSIDDQKSSTPELQQANESKEQILDTSKYNITLNTQL